MMWYQKSYRRNLVDMHINDWDPEFFSEFSPEEYYNNLVTAKIQSPMIYLHSHIGLCNWDSLSGVTHSAFKNNNKIKTLIDLCHAGGMDVIGYYSIIYNTTEYERHPDWRMIDSEGMPSRFIKSYAKTHRYGLLCPNNMEYRGFLKEQFKEIISTYDLEGIFLDMTFWPMVCHCDSCRKRYYNETGNEIPAAPDWNDPNWLQFQECREKWLGEFAAYCTAELKTLQPDLSVEHQFAAVLRQWKYGVTELVTDVSDYAGGDLCLDCYHQNFMCKLLYETTANQPFEYMATRCDPNLCIHTTTKSIDKLRLENLIISSHHGASLFIDAIDPVGTLDRHVYEDIGKVYSESMPYEKYYKGKLVSDVALYCDLKSKINVYTQPDMGDLPIPQFDAVIGASIALNNENIPFTVIPGGRRDKIFSHKIVTVCEAPRLSDEEISDLITYVEQGGGLYISGMTNPRLAEALLGLKYEGITKDTVTYIAPSSLGTDIFGSRYSEKIPMTYLGNQVKVSNPAGHDVLATVALSYTPTDDPEIFASINSNPPGKNTDYPALVYGEYGRGRVLWSSSSFEKNPQKAHKQIWLNALRLLNNDIQRIKCTAPDFVQVTLFDDPEENCMYLHLINAQELEEVVPLPPFRCRLELRNTVKQIDSLPDEGSVELWEKDGAVEFTVEGLDIVRMYRLHYQA